MDSGTKFINLWTYPAYSQTRARIISDKYEFRHREESKRDYVYTENDDYAIRKPSHYLYIFIY